MKRDLDLIRKILLKVESLNPNENCDVSSFIDEYDEDTIRYHFYLLAESCYVEAYEISCCDGHDLPNYVIRFLTPFGCDYLDAVRDDSIWAKTKETLKSVGGSASLEVISTIASQLIAKTLNF